MGSRVDIFRLEADHGYSIVKAEKRTDMLGYVHDSSSDEGGRTYVIARPSILAQNPPVKLRTWEELVGYEPPIEDETPRKWLIYAQGDDYMPLGLGGPVPEDERRELEKDILLSSVQRGIANSSRSDIIPKWTGITTVVIVGLVVLVSLVIMGVGLQQFLLTPTSDAPPPAAEQTLDPAAIGAPIDGGIN